MFVSVKDVVVFVGVLVLIVLNYFNYLYVFGVVSCEWVWVVIVEFGFVLNELVC